MSLLILLEGKGPHIVNLSTSTQVVFLRAGAIPGTQHSSLLLACWTFNGSSSYIGLGKWEPMLLGLCMTTIPVPIATLLMFYHVGLGVVDNRGG